MFTFTGNRYARKLWTGLIAVPLLMVSLHSEAHAAPEISATEINKWPKPPTNHARAAR
ncbi:hypothetical protein [Cohnella cholangitidis]|uniref:hypothetical protein n=1 Tax=Cohnella cholangitidis TaxID=2598458 RepID=UPI0015FA79F3